MRKKIAVVTGGKGFLGSKLVSDLLKANYLIRLILRTGSLNDFHESVEVIFTNDLNYESVQWWHAVTRDADILIHCAWYVEHSDYMESTNNLSCLIGVTNIALGAILSGVKKFVGIGTCLEYKDPFSTLNKELIPNSLYASSKLCSYYLLSQIFKNTTTDFLWCRLYYLYGDGEKPSRLVPYIKRQIEVGEPVVINDGNKIIDILEISDAANMIIKSALGADKGPIDIRSGRTLSVREFAMGIAKEVGKELLIK